MGERLQDVFAPRRGPVGGPADGQCRTTHHASALVGDIALEIVAVDFEEPRLIVMPDESPEGIPLPIGVAHLCRLSRITAVAVLQPLTQRDRRARVVPGP